MAKYPTTQEIVLAELLNKNKTSGGKNSTAKTVSVTHAMTNEETEKRQAYNAAVNAGMTDMGYQEYSKVVTVPAKKKAAAVSGTTVVTAPTVRQPSTVADAPTPAFVKYAPKSSTEFFNTWVKPLRDARAKVDAMATGVPFSTEYYNTAMQELKTAEEDYAYIKKTDVRKTIDALDLGSNEMVTHEKLTMQNLHEFERAQKANTMHMVFLTDENKICTTSRIGVSELSRHYVADSEGVSVLYYDTVTNKFYSITAEDEHTKKLTESKGYWAGEIKKIVDGLESDAYTSINSASKIAERLNTYQTKLDTNTMSTADWDAYNTLADQYITLTATPEYSEQLAKYTAEYNRLLEYQKNYDDVDAEYNAVYGNDTIVATKDWLDAVNKEVDKVNNVRKEYQEQVVKNKYLNGYDDRTEINTLADGFKRMIGKIGSGTWWTEQWKEYEGYGWARPLFTAYDALTEPVVNDFVWEGLIKSVVWDTFTQPIKGVVTGDLTALEGSNVLFNNLVVNIGELGDALHIFKPFVVANWSYDNPEARAQSPLLQEAYENTNGFMEYSSYLFNAWTGAYGTKYDGTANIELIWLAGEDPTIFDTVGAVALDIALDPTTWLSALTSKFATESAKGITDSSLDSIVSFTRTVESMNDLPVELTEKQIIQAANKAGKKAIKTGADYSTLVANQLAKSHLAASNLKIGSVLNNIPDNAIGSFIRNSIDEVEFSVRRATYSLLHPIDSGATQSLFKSFASEVNLNDMLIDAYKIIDKTSNIYKAMDTIDSFMFNMVLPVEPIAKVARVLKNVIVSTSDTIRASVYLNRVASKTAHLIDESGVIPMSNMDEFIDIVEGEAKVFNKNVYNDIGNTVHRAVRMYNVDTQLNSLLDAVNAADLRKRGSAAEVLESLAKRFKQMGTEEMPIEDMHTFMHYLKKPLGDSQHSVYDMLDSSLVIKLRTFQAEYNRLVRIRALDELATLSDGVLNWKGFIKQRIADIIDAPKNSENILEQLSNEFGQVIKVFDDTEKLFIEQLTTVNKTEVQEAIRIAQQEVCDVFDAAINGEVVSRFKLDLYIDNVQKLLDKYISDVRDVYARRYFQHMDSKVERVLLPRATKPDTAALHSEFIKGFLKAINNQYSVDISEEVLSNHVLKSLEQQSRHNKLDFNEYLRVYNTMPEKASRVLAYVSDEHIQQHLAPFLGNNSTVLGVIDVLENSPLLLEPTGDMTSLHGMLVSFQKEAVTLSTTIDINKQIAKLDVEDSLKVGVLDALAGEQSWVNNVWRKTSLDDGNAVARTVDAITNHIIDKAAEYISQKDGSYGVKLFDPVLEEGGGHVPLCALNPAENVDNMCAHLDSIPFAKEYLTEQADDYYDIYFSLSKVGDNTPPYAVAFRHGDETVMFKNRETRFRPEKDYISNTHGMSLEDARKSFSELNMQDGLSRADFDDAINEQLLHYKECAKKDNKQIRFIGYNNGNMGTRQDVALRKLIQKNAITVHNDITVDLADFVRVDRGIPVFSTSARTQVRDCVHRCVNISAAHRTQNLLTVFDHKLFTDAHNVATSLAVKKATCAQIISEPYMDSTINAIRNLGDAVTNVSAQFSDSTNVLKDICVNEKALLNIIQELNPSAHITGINIHALLEEAMSYTGADFTVNAYKILDTAKYKYLFNLNKLSNTVRVSELQSLKTVSDELLTNISNIRQPEVLEEVGFETYRELYIKMLKESKIGNMRKRADLRVLTYALDNDNKDANVMFSACRYFLTRSRLDYMEFVRKLREEHNTKLLDALYTVNYADEIVFNSGSGSFTHAHKMFVTNLYGESTDHANLLVDMQEFDECLAISKNLTEYINKKTAIQQGNNVISAAEQIYSETFRTIAEPYIDFVQSFDVKALPPSAFSSRLSYIKHVHAVSKKVNEIKQHVALISDLHREAALRTVFSLSDEDFFIYLVRDCKNNLVLDINNSFMQDSKTRNIVMNKLEELRKSTLFDFDDSSKDGIIKIFHSKERLANTDMDEFYRTILDKHVDYTTGYRAHRAQLGQKMVKEMLEDDTLTKASRDTFKSFVEKYVHLEDKMAEQMPGHWLVSTYTTNTQATAEHLQEVFPEAARFNLADMNEYGMFNDAFTCSVWADSNVIRRNNFIQYYSDNSVKSIGVGIYQVRNNLEAINNKFALYSNKRMSLKWITEHGNIQINDYRVLNQQLESAGWMLHKGWTDEHGKMHVRRILLESNADLKKVLNDDTIVATPMNVYSELIQYAKGNNAAVDVDKRIGNSREMYEMVSYGLDQARIAYAATALFTRMGTWFKNGPDGLLRASLETGDLPGLLSKCVAAGELLQRYETVHAKITNKFHRCKGPEIARYFREYPDDTCGLSLETMQKIYAHKSSAAAGTMAGTIAALQNDAVFNKLLGLCEDTPEITEDMLKKVMNVYHKEAIRAQIHPHRDFIKHKLKVREALEKLGYEGKLLDKFTDLYTANSSAMTDFLYNSPSLLARMQALPAPDVQTFSKLSKSKSAMSNLMTFNANMFGGIEDRLRLGLVLYYTDELGYSVDAVSSVVKKTQFDYSARPVWLDRLEGFFPFITYSLYNAKYWLFDAPRKHGVIRTATKIAMASETYYDEEEYLNVTRGMLLRRKLASGEIVQNEDGTIDYEDSPNSVWAAFAHTILGADGVVEEYQGQLRRYAQMAGSLPLGNYHVLKIGNSFLDAIDFVEMAVMAVPQILRGEVPALLQEKIYTPIRVMLGAFAHYTKHGFNQEALNTWIEENWYDTLAFLPYYGTLVNNAITHLKNGRLNLRDLWVIVSNPQLKDEFLYTLYEQFLCVLGAAVPSIIGTVYDTDYFSRPIGYDWYNQDEEYRKTHRYVWGVSYVPAWTKKNPGEYINYLGKYIELGYTKEQALEILNVLFGHDDTAPVQWAFNQTLFDDTLKYLLEHDYSMEEALELLNDKALWDTSELAKRLGAITQQQAMENSVFYKMYDMLPDYIKYTDGQYAALRKYYTSLGYNEEQTWAAMWTGKGFIDPTGTYKPLTPEKVTTMNQEINDAYAEFMLGLPDWYKYEPGAATRAVKYLKDIKGMNTDQARKYIISTNFYVTADGKPTHFTAEESRERAEQSSKEFKEYYNTLPDFIKYEAGAYGRTLKYLLGLGYSEDEAKEMIQKGMYLTLDGDLINCTGLTRKKQYNTSLTNKYYRSYRKYITRAKRIYKRNVRVARVRRPYKLRSNNSMTYSLVNIRNGANFGAQRAYKVTLGYNSAASILSTKGNYPSTWRNVAQAYRRNLYKEHYAKYGMSRISMRSGVWKGYSNASVTRLRRENVYAARRYRNRRVF